jgi:hypothetical protein
MPIKEVFIYSCDSCKQEETFFVWLSSGQHTCGGNLTFKEVRKATSQDDNHRIAHACNHGNDPRMCDEGCLTRRVKMLDDDEIRRPLFKTTIVIWSHYDPKDRKMEINHLAQEAVSGDAYCAKEETVEVKHPVTDPDFEDGDFFRLPEV